MSSNANATNIVFVVIFTVLILSAAFVELGGEEKERKAFKIPPAPYLNVRSFCDESTNVEYLIYVGHKAGGISPRYLIDGSLKSCDNQLRGNDN